MFGKDYVTAGDSEPTDSVLNDPLVFVGYGVTAPELKYDDYAGLFVRGNVVVLLHGASLRFPSVQRAESARSALLNSMNLCINSEERL